MIHLQVATPWPQTSEFMPLGILQKRVPFSCSFLLPENHPRPAGHTLPNAPQDPIGVAKNSLRSSVICFDGSVATEWLCRLPLPWQHICWRAVGAVFSNASFSGLVSDGNISLEVLCNWICCDCLLCAMLKYTNNNKQKWHFRALKYMLPLQKFFDKYTRLPPSPWSLAFLLHNNWQPYEPNVFI